MDIDLLGELCAPPVTDDQVSTFLAKFPTQPHYTKPKGYYNLWVFWNQNERSQNNSSSDDPGLLPDIPDPWIIHDKIKSCFSNFECCSNITEDVLIQFWAPATIGGRQLLRTSDQPFALRHLDLDLLKYRLSFLKRKYNVNVDVNAVEVEDDPTIISGAPAAAFLNRLGVYFGHPPLECEPMTCFVLPICDPSREGCVGVVECSMKMGPSYFEEYLFHNLTQVLEEALQEALQEVGLRIYRVSESVPYKNIPRLEHARDEIKDALKFICDSHGLRLAQVWIPYEDANHVPLSSCTKVTRMKQVLALKLVGHLVDLVHISNNLVNYCNSCDLLALEIGEGLIAKTLETREPHFRTQTFYDEMDHNSFSIWLKRDIQARELDYVFEFLWPQGRNRDILLEELLLTLKRRLGSFKYASGAELGDELCIVDFENHLGSEIEKFKIFKGKRAIPVHKATEEGRRRVKYKAQKMSEEGRRRVKYKTQKITLTQEAIEQQFGLIQEEAAEKLEVSVSTLKRRCNFYGIKWQGPEPSERMVNGLYQTGTDEEDNRAIQDPRVIIGDTNSDENTLIITAEHEEDLIRFHLPISSATFVAIEEEIGKRIKLNNGSHKLKYCDENGEWILMVCDEDLKACIGASRLSKTNRIRMRVLRSC